MNNKLKHISIFFLFLLATSFSLAQGCSDEGWKGYSRIHDNKTITITCPTCDYINFTAVNDEGIFLDNVGMSKSGNTFSYIFLGTDLDSVETIQLDGYSNLDVPLAICFDVTMTGEEPSLGTYIMLLIIAMLFFLSLVWVTFRFNQKRRDELYNKIVAGYFKHNLGQDKGNLGVAILYTIAYGLLRNLLMFYYLSIIFFMFIITELVESFAIKSLITLFTTILSVSLWGFIAVFIVMIFNFYEIIMSLIKDVGDSYLGAFNGK